jgi:hypothetical protein
MEEQLDIMRDKITSMENKMDKIEELLTKVSKDTTRMDSHITFVERIYETIKSPFHYILGKTEKILTFRDYTTLEYNEEKHSQTCKGSGMGEIYWEKVDG